MVGGPSIFSACSGEGSDEKSNPGVYVLMQIPAILNREKLGLLLSMTLGRSARLHPPYPIIVGIPIRHWSIGSGSGLADPVSAPPCQPRDIREHCYY